MSEAFERVLARGAAPVCGAPIHSDELNADIGSRKDNPFAINEKAQGHPGSRTRVVNLVRLAIVLVCANDFLRRRQRASTLAWQRFGKRLQPPAPAFF